MAADKMNIQFRLRAVDGFSKIMNRLEAKLAKLQIAADALDLRHHGSITMDVDEANAKMNDMRDQYQTLHQDIDRAMKPRLDTSDYDKALNDMKDKHKDIDKQINDANGGAGNGGGNNNNGIRDRDGGSGGGSDDDATKAEKQRIKDIEKAYDDALKEDGNRTRQKIKNAEKVEKANLQSIKKQMDMLNRAHSMNEAFDRQMAKAREASNAKHLKQLEQVRKENDKVTAGVMKDIKALEKKAVRMTINYDDAMKSSDEIRRELEHIQDSADTMRIRMNAAEALRELNRLELKINDLDRAPIPITAEARAALREVDSVKRSLDAVNRKVVQLDINERDFLVGIQRAQRMLDYLETQNPTVEVDAEIASATAQLNSVIALASQVGTLDPTVRVDVDGFAAAMARLEAIDNAADKVDRTSVVQIFVAGYHSFRRQMDRIATTGRNIGEIVTNMFMGTALAFSSILVPVIASTVGSIASIGVAAGVSVGALGGLSSALVAAAGGAGLYASVAIPAISKVTESAGDIRDMQEDIDKAVAMGDAEGAKKKLDEMAYALSQLSNAERGAVTALNEFKDAHEGLVKKFEGKVFETFALALETVTGLLERSEGIIGSVADAVQGLMESLSANLNSADFNDFFAFLETHAAPALTAITKAAGNFLMGFLNIMEAFAPLSVDMQDGFLAMSESFRKWGAALSENKKFQAFTEYVRENWPKVRAIIGKAISGIITLFAQFAPYASEWMDRVSGMMDTFIAFGSSLGSNPEFQRFMDYMSEAMPKVNKFISSFVKAVIAIGEALAPVGLVMLDVGTYIFDLITNFQDANPEIATLIGWIGTLAAGFFAILPILVIIKTTFGILFNLITKGGGVFGIFTKLLGGWVGVAIALFVAMWTKSEMFRDIITSAFNSIKENVGAAIESVVGFVMEQWGKLTAYWEENGTSIMEAAKNVWGFIEGFINGALIAILVIFEKVWPIIKGIVVGVWDAIKLVISGALDIIMGLVSVFSGIFTGDWQLVWDGVKQIFSGAFKAILGLISLHFFGKLLKGVGGFIAAFGGSLRGMWTSLTTGAATSVANLRTKVLTGITNMRTGLDNIVGNLVTGVRTRFSGMVTNTKQLWDDLVLSVTTKVSNFRTKISDTITAVKTFFTNTTNSLKDNALNIFETLVAGVIGKVVSMADSIGEKISGIKDWFVDTFNEIVEFVSGISFADIGSNLISGLTGGLTAGKGGLFSTMSGIASKLIGSTENDFDVHSPSRVFKTIGEQLMAGMAVGIANKETAAITAAQHAAQVISKAFNPEMVANAEVQGVPILNKGNAYNGASVSRSAEARAAVNAPQRQQAPQAQVDPYAAMQNVTIEIPVHIDGREVARSTRRPLKDLDRREVQRQNQFAPI